MTRVNKINIFQAVVCVCGWLVFLDAWAGQSQYRDPNKIIVVKPSAPVVNVRLQANPSTGYQWVLIQYDHALMEPPTSRFLPQHRGMVGVPGAPGYTVWQFKFKKIAFAIPRKTQVILEYKRPWEHVPGHQQKIHFTIKSK
jgi:predicted secreted protein